MRDSAKAAAKAATNRISCQVRRAELSARRFGGQEVPLPAFVGIGAQKAGTTWLSRNLSHHDDVFVPEPHDVHFFDRKLVPSVARYAQAFAGHGPARILGDITPAYAVMTKHQVATVRDLLPDVRLLFLLRDPRARAWSHARMTLRRRHGSLEGVPDQEYLEHFNSQRSLSRGRYSASIRLWTDAFPAEQLWIGLHADIVARPLDLLQEVFTHIGAELPQDLDSYPAADVFNRGTQKPLPGRFSEVLSELYRDEICAMRSLLGDNVRAWET